jgi:hypothetical protein
MFLFSGMLYERHSVPSYLRWMQELSLVNYSFGAYVTNEARWVIPHNAWARL